MRTLNLGILAHVDAGKTTLTDQLLYHAGIIDAPGSVDRGTTQTDTLDLERERGITIRSAVVSFHIGDLKVNLIDTPGHPDFIAEVERALRVLDGVVLVVSAVEGIQPQTRLLFRVILARGLPCVIFINKVDRAGARIDDLVDDLKRELNASPILLSHVSQPGARDVTSAARDLTHPAWNEAAIDALGRHDPDLLDCWVRNDGWLDAAFVQSALNEQSQSAVLQPVVCGSAMMGIGIDQLLDALVAIAPVTAIADRELPLAAEVFKVERSANGERSVICRIWQGTLAVRETVAIVRPHDDTEIPPARVTRLLAYANGQLHQAHEAVAGDMARLSGLAEARIGDWLGMSLGDRVPAFEPPVFEYQVLPRQPERQFDLHRSLVTLADEDPLIDVRIDEMDQASFVHLYGEVQREVVEHTLLDRFGLASDFGPPAVICVERLRGPGAAAEIFGETDPPFYATVGFRIRPRQGPQSSWTFTPGKAKRNFFDAAEIGGRTALAEGPHGWPIVDIDVEVTDLIYLTSSTPADYRRLAALVMAEAVKLAGTVVCEPTHRFVLRTPAEHSGACIHLLSSHRGEIESTAVDLEVAAIHGSIPAASIGTVAKALPGISNGRGDLETRFHDYQPIAGDRPERRRTGLNPYHRAEYLSRLSGRFSSQAS